MPHSDYGFEDDDTVFIAAATQVEASQHADFEASPRPTKRRRVRRRGPRQVDGASSDGLEWSETDDEAHSPAKLPSIAFIQQRTAEDDEPEEDAEYYFPGEAEGQLEQPARNSKYKIYAPKNGGQFEDQVFTQTQVGLDSSPSHFRGAVWKKPKPPPPPVFSEQPANVNGNAKHNSNASEDVATEIGSRQTLLSGVNGFARPNVRGAADGFQSDLELAARLQADENDPHRAKTTTVGKIRSPLEKRAPCEVSNELLDLPSDAFSSSSRGNSPDKDVILITSQATASQQPVRGLRAPQQGLKQMDLYGRQATQEISATQAAKKKHAWPLKARDEPLTHHKLDEKAMETWVYPTNLGTIRSYQYNIVVRSLFHNTLVALPTGLGKTFIAATIMLNYYRWTKDAQIVFMAPTKPLIAQQMDACYHIVGIPRNDTVLMTGETSPPIRAEEWLEKRVFFMTPQTVINDLKTGICDPKKIVLMVVDEAHKATGSYAYSEVIKFMRRFNNSFRVLALTATPGSTVEAVQAVIDNIGIARVELRTEISLDIRQYTHEKHTETELFDHSIEQSQVMDLFSKALRPILDKLCSNAAYWSRDPMALTAFGLTTARQKWANSDAGRKAAMPVKGMVQAYFQALSSLAHSITLLKNHGIIPFFSGVSEYQKNFESGQTKSKTAAQIVQSEHFVEMARRVRGWINNPDFISHPKLQYLREVVLNHFLDTGQGRQGYNVPPSATRVMVFTSYRDSAEEIAKVLKRNEPMIRPHVFVGQAATKGSEGMDQKRQNAVIQDFKSGKYNTLVATSIGEEGLDIGDVDLIVCYDASASPIRMLQRIGRTGRKRTGKVVLLLMKGKEENDYAKAQDNYTYIQKTIADTSKYTYREEHSPRILPKGVQPVVDKRDVDIPVENSQPIDTNERGRKPKGRGKAKKPPKKFHMPDGVRTTFVTASNLDSDGEDDSDGRISRKRKIPARQKTPAKMEAAPAPQIEPAQIPFLEDVLLTSEQRGELARKYAHTADDTTDTEVQRPDPSRHREAIRQLGPTESVRHGRASEIVSKTMRAMHAMDDEKMEQMKEKLDMSDLQESGTSHTRLVSPADEVANESDDPPQDKLPAPVRNKAAKPRAKKAQAVQRRASTKSVGTTDAGNVNPTSAAKKPRGRARNNQKVQRIRSYGSAAAEGASSSPEPTPANMRIGTQGIDLGSKDTSGEEDDEEPDSELEEFVVRSDQPIEMASSSQRLPDDTQPPAQAKRRDVGLVKRPVPSMHGLSDSENEDDADEAGLASVHGDTESEVEEVMAPAVFAPTKARKSRVVVGSDSDE